ncbi:signal peptidase II [Pseudalkalibacillus hwajinpoensis]|uniref:signal peptidase II n=1 Tax=Guptibacillus hwajinpoensis TaxID=208199 RepID=UPI00325B013F
MKRMIMLIAGFLVIDFMTKRLMDADLQLHERNEIVEGYLSWQLYYNPGATLGLLEGYTELLIGLQILIVLLLSYGYWQANPKTLLVKTGFALIISGGLSNLIDRIQYGYVIDFISIKGSPGIFNVADMEIRFGFIMIVALYLMRRFTIPFLDKLENPIQKSERS